MRSPWLALTLGVGICLVSTTGAQANPPGGLLDAYRKEFAFLEAQKRALQKRLSEVETAKRAKLSQARGRIAALQGTLIHLRSKADELAQTLREVQRSGAPVTDEDKVGDTIERARQSLEKLGLKLPADENKALGPRLVILAQMFTQAGAALGRGGAIRQEPGHFFLPNGTRVKGTLVRVGAIATYGLSDQGSGALAPAGQGRLKLWPKNAASTARALREGRHPDFLSIFLYESLDKDVQPKRVRSWLETIRAGGLVAWVIVFLGLGAALLILLRICILGWSSLGTRRLPRLLGPLLDRGALDEARALTKKTRGPMARVLRATLAHVDRTRDQLEDAVSEALLRETPRIERFSAIITVFAAVAPLLGLLGTVTGMISTFDVITEHGTGDPKLLSGGISEALITTQLGLMVAIPTLLVGTLLRGRAEALQASMERAVLHVINLATDSVVPTDGDPTGSAPLVVEDPPASLAPPSTAKEPLKEPLKEQPLGSPGRLAQEPT